MMLSAALHSAPSRAQDVTRNLVLQARWGFLRCHISRYGTTLLDPLLVKVAPVWYRWRGETRLGGSGVPIYVVPKVLRDRLGDEATEALVEFHRQVSEQNRTDLLALAEERLERRLVEAAATIRTEIANTRAELRAEIANTRADLIKRMFISWAGQVAVILGILFAWFRR